MVYKTLIIFATLLTGCVSLPRHRREIAQSYIQGLQKARSIAHYQHCDDAVHIISGRIDVEEMRDLGQK